MAEFRSPERRMLPLFLNLERKPIVIFGGGNVGERKARLFSEYGLVRVISLDFTPGLMDLNGNLELIAADARLGFEKYLDGAFIVIPATNDPKLNEAIELAARKRGILVNRVDGMGDVVVPSLIKKGSISIAISTQVPGLTKHLRMRLEKELAGDYDKMAELLSGIRAELKDFVPNQKDRAKIIWKILEDDEIWNLLESSYEKAYMKARSHACQDERDSLDAGDASQSLHR